MIKTSLEFAPDTAPKIRELAKAIPPYDLLKAYRAATAQFNTSDVVLLVAINDGEILDFQAMPRAEYVGKAMNRAAALTHPVGRQSAHKKLAIPADTPAFWVVFELHDQGIVAPCAIGSYQYEVTPVEGELTGVLH